MSSFYSERTIEYILVPKLCDLIHKYKKNVVPLFFRQLREGTNLSSALFGNKKFQIIAMFARRGKLSNSNDYLHIKINHSVIKMFEKLNSIGIPVIFGSSNARSLIELSNSQVNWFSIDKISYNNLDDIYLALDDKEFAINENEIIKLIDKSRLFEFEEMCFHLEELRKKEKSESRLPWFSRTWVYEPVYFLVFDK
jgi:hypothetical protein